MQPLIISNHWHCSNAVLSLFYNIISGQHPGTNRILVKNYLQILSEVTLPT